jgi:hypothetical protein
MIMDAKEFYDEMLRISKEYDFAERHFYADDTMCDLLRELGYGDGVDVFENMGKWYS